MWFCGGGFGNWVFFVAGFDAFRGDLFFMFDVGLF